VWAAQLATYAPSSDLKGVGVRAEDLGSALVSHAVCLWPVHLQPEGPHGAEDAVVRRQRQEAAERGAGGRIGQHPSPAADIGMWMSLEGTVRRLFVWPLGTQFRR
jgi:hypothetical protein